MVDHTALGDSVFARGRVLYQQIANGNITLAGYKVGKIYGKLTCKSGKRMKAENRVFFWDETDALAAGYRPCGHCLPKEYKIWKLNNGII